VNDLHKAFKKKNGFKNAFVYFFNKVFCLMSQRAKKQIKQQNVGLELAKQLVGIATDEYGIPIEDIVVDPLAMPIGADHTLAMKTMEAIHLISTEIGVNTTLGASNVSFGMPDRHTLNAVFLPMAMKAGLTSAIMDSRTPQIVTAVKGADLMMGNDEWGATWIAAHRAKQAAAQAAEAAAQA
jgi:5-methyltetrahydrofolate--homocysteine methyltransferase